MLVNVVFVNLKTLIKIHYMPICNQQKSGKGNFKNVETEKCVCVCVCGGCFFFFLTSQAFLVQTVMLQWQPSHQHHLLAHILNTNIQCSGAGGCLLPGCQTDQSVNQPEPQTGLSATW